MVLREYTSPLPAKMLSSTEITSTSNPIGLIPCDKSSLFLSESENAGCSLSTNPSFERYSGYIVFAEFKRSIASEPLK